jgi:integrase
MKAGREHRVPLSNRVLAILEKLAGTRTGEFVAGQRAGKPLSDLAMEMILRRMKAESVTGDATERAYRRGPWKSVVRSWRHGRHFANRERVWTWFR